MSEWHITKEKLQCGLLRISPTVLKDRFSDLARTIQRYASREGQFEVIKINPRDYSTKLLYHAFVPNDAIDYEDCSMNFTRVATLESKELDRWLEVEFKPSVGEDRQVDATWKIENLWTLRIYLGMSRYLNDDERNQSAEPPIFSVRVRFETDDATQLTDEQLRISAEQAQRARAALQPCLGQLFSQPSRRDNQGMPEDLVTIDYALDRACELFCEGIKCVSGLFGEDAICNFSIESPDLAMRLQETADIDARVWSEIEIAGRIKKSVDVYQTPTSQEKVHAYVLLTALTDREFLFQLTIVHTQGESFLECQALDPVWFDWLANYFQASIDLWHGPIATRFGWYADAQLGELKPYAADPQKKLDKNAAKKLAAEQYYLVFPAGIDHFGDRYEINDKRYEDPAAIFCSLSEAESYAAEHRVELLDWDVPGLTSKIRDFDLTQLSTCNQICQMLGITDQTKWRDGLGNYSPSSLSASDRNRLIELLNIKSYRIVKLELDPRDYVRIVRAIEDVHFSEKARAWLAKACGMVVYEEE